MNAFTAVAPSSTAQLKDISEKKNTPDQLYERVELMCVSLVMGMEDYLRHFCVSAAIPVLLKLAEKQVVAENGDCVMILLRALSLILEHAPSMSEGAAQLHRSMILTCMSAMEKTGRMAMRFNRAEPVTLLEEAMRLLRFVCRDDDSGSVVNLGFIPYLTNMAQYDDPRLVRQALETLSTICAKVVFGDTKPNKPRSSSMPPSLGFISALFSRKKVKKVSVVSEVELKVSTEVESNLIPLLQQLVAQYSSGVDTSLEMWPLLELVLECLGLLLQRAMLCDRPMTASKIATAKLAETLFCLMNVMENNVVLDPQVREDRILHCETMLTLLVESNPMMMRQALLSRDAKAFYRRLFNNDAHDITLLLQDPFPIASAASRSTQRRDKDQLTSIAAVRLLLLTCPRVPIDAFGPKPKLLLPVHQWKWEDELRHASPLPEDQCAALDTCLATLRPTVVVRVQAKSVSVNLITMKLKSASGNDHRNISRDFVPFVFYNANEVSLRREGTAPADGDPKRSWTGTSPTMGSLQSAPFGTSPLGTGKRLPNTARAAQSLSSLTSLGRSTNGLVISTDIVDPRDIAIAEEYLLPLCEFASHASGQMAKQSATCACAAVLQLALISGAGGRARALLHRAYRPLNEMLRGALATADKATKAVALSMMQWMLRHPYAAPHKFTIACVRCGVPEQLEVLAATRAPATRTVPVSVDHRGSVTDSEEQATRTAYLSGVAGLLLEELGIAAAMSGSNSSSPSKRKAAEIKTLGELSAELLGCSTKPGMHEQLVSELMKSLQEAAGMTSFEFFQLGIATSILAYLSRGSLLLPSTSTASSTNHSVGHSAGAHLATASPTNASLGSGADGSSALLVVGRPAGSPQVSRTPAGRQAGGLAVDGCIDDYCATGFCDPEVDVLTKLDSERVGCFLQQVREQQSGTKALIEQLVAVLPFTSNFPLVESVISDCKVVCRPPAQALTLLSACSPMVSLCRPRSSSVGPFAGAPPTAPDAAGDKLCMCPKGHALQTQLTKSVVCDACNVRARQSMACRACNYDLCFKCAATFIQSAGGSGSGSARSGASRAPVGGSAALQQPPATTCVAPLSFERAHLLAAIGDIERFFRTGSSSTKNTITSPAPHSALQNEQYLYTRLRTALEHVEEKDEVVLSKETSADFQLSRLRHVTGLLSVEMQRQRVLRDPRLVTKETRAALEASSAVAMSTAPMNKEEADMDAFVRKALEERYILYTDSTGRCPSQETLIGNIYRRAFHRCIVPVLEQLENCLMRTAETTNDLAASVVNPEDMPAMGGGWGSVQRASSVHGEPSSPMLNAAAGVNSSPSTSSGKDGAAVRGTGGVAGLAGAGPAQRPSLTSSGIEFCNGKISPAQTYCFHHFLKDSDANCCCGSFDRTSFLSQEPPLLKRRAPAFATCPYVHLLIVLHKLLKGAMDAGTLAFDSSVFLNHDMTTLIVKAANVSALRLAILPVQFAVPRWVYFALKHCQFLMSLRVRTKLAHFLSHGARRNLWAHMRLVRATRMDSKLKVSPGEWARMSNHKYRIWRHFLLDDAYTVLRKCAESRFPISIEFEGDEGVGQGPTAHFYTLVAEELTRAKHSLWRNISATVEGKSAYGETAAEDRFVVPPNEGLFPRVCTEYAAAGGVKQSAPVTPLASAASQHVSECPFPQYRDFAEMNAKFAAHFYLVGVALGRAFVDEQVFPLQVSPALALILSRGIPCFRAISPNPAEYSGMHPVDLMGMSVDDVALVDAQVARSLKALSKMDPATLEAAGLPFTMPGDDSYELVPNGKSIAVTASNFELYMRRVIGAILFESSAQALRLIACGCHDVVPRDALALFTAQELAATICGVGADPTAPLWTRKEIQSILVPDHGYQKDSPQMAMLVDILAGHLNPKEQRAFLLFCTGCPRLPIGGITAMGPITVAKRYDEAILWRRNSEEESDVDGEPLGTPALDEEPGRIGLRFVLPSVSQQGNADGSARRGSSSQHDADGAGQLSEACTLPRKRATSSATAAGADEMLSRSAPVLCASGEDWSLPSVNTCFRYLKLPPYPTKELMQRKLLLSITQSGDTFELS